MYAHCTALTIMRVTYMV